MTTTLTSDTVLTDIVALDKKLDVQRAALLTAKQGDERCAVKILIDELLDERIELMKRRDEVNAS